VRFAGGGRTLERLAGGNATRRERVPRRWSTLTVGEDPWRETRAEDAPWLRERRPAMVREAAQQALLFPATRFLAKPRVVGANDLIHAPQPAILAPNHESDIDTPLLLLALPHAWRMRTVVGAASDRWYRKRSYGLIAGFWINTFPFDRGGGQRRGLAAAAAHLRAGVPIVPVHIEGSALVMPKGRGVNRRARTTVTFLRPIAPRAGESADELTARLRLAVEEPRRRDRRTAAG
jgi:1-acyl-sn-glycerol-3-phosphate acyltransferase